MELKEAEIPEQDSLLLTRNLLHIAIFKISYIRGLFPEKYFNDKSVPDLDMKIKKLMPMDAESCRLIDWMEKGVYDALQRKYLKKLMFCICETVDGPMLDEYSFSFSYLDTGRKDVMMNVDRTGNGGTFNSTADITPNQMRSSACKMVHTLLVQLMSTLEKMPDERTIVMKLLYYDNVTPPDYEPPFFRGCTEEEAQYVWTKNPLRMETGDVNSKHLVSKLKVKSGLDPCEDENDDAKSIGPDSVHDDQPCDLDSEISQTQENQFIVAPLEKLHDDDDDGELDEDYNTQDLVENDQQLARVRDWINSRHHDTLDLKTLIFCISETVDGPMIEEYSSSLSYSGSYTQDVMMKINQNHQGAFSSTADIIPNQMRSSAWKTVPTLVEQMKTDLDKMPSDSDSKIIPTQDNQLIVAPVGCVNDQGNCITPSSAGFTDSERLIGEASKNQSVVMFEEYSFKFWPDDGLSERFGHMLIHQPTGMARRGGRKQRRRKQNRGGGGYTQAQIFDPEFSDDDRHTVMNDDDSGRYIILPRRSTVIGQLPFHLQNSLKQDRSVLISSDVAKKCLGTNRFSLVPRSDRLADKFTLSDYLGRVHIYWPTKTLDRRFLSKRETSAMLMKAAGDVHDQEDHPLCWDFVLCDMTSATAVLHGQMKKYEVLSPTYLCENVSRQSYNTKEANNEVHHCYPCSFYDAVKFLKESDGLPKATQNEKNDFDCTVRRPIIPGEERFCITNVFRYKTLEEALVRLVTHPLAATLTCFRGWEDSGVYSGPKVGDKYQGEHEVLMIDCIEVQGKPVIRCKASNGLTTGNSGYIYVSPELMLLVAGGSRKRDGETSCLKRPQHLLYDFYSVDMEMGRYPAKFAEDASRKKDNSRFREDFTRKKKCKTQRGMCGKLKNEEGAKHNLKGLSVSCRGCENSGDETVDLLSHGNMEVLEDWVSRNQVCIEGNGSSDWKPLESIKTTEEVAVIIDETEHLCSGFDDAEIFKGEKEASYERAYSENLFT